MLLSRAEMRFDFGGARFDPIADREILRWMLSQFLYGEVTGVQVGHWLHAAPDLEAARFLARQAVEELQHVGSFLKIMQLLGVSPEPAHPMLRFLATGMMGDDWPEHVALEMATGEGFVLVAFYALIDTLGHREGISILERAARQEESHVTFGEQRCMRLIAEHPELKAQLLGANLVWMWGVRQLSSYIDKHLPKTHPVLSQLQPFLQHALRCTELRLMRMGLAEGPLSELSTLERSRLLFALAKGKATSSAKKLWRSPRRLTDSYLSDPDLRRLLTEVGHQRHMTH
ncbi:MAG: ferritin-like domain-containing protein [Polyangiales bacterium]